MRMDNLSRAVGMMTLVVACAPTVEDAGSDDATSESDSGAAEQGIVGTWIGYADAAMLPSGSDRVALVVSAVAGDGTITATLSFGAEGSLPPATDPDVGYPPGYVRWDVVEQFAFAVTGNYDDALQRLQGTYEPYDVWSGWCALQTPYPTDNGDSYRCVPNCTLHSESQMCTLLDCGEHTGPIDCGKVDLCRGVGGSVCHCNAAACTNESVAISIDMHLVGDALDGPIESVGTTHLVRD